MEQNQKFIGITKRGIFITVFFTLFCLSFILSILTHFQYRAAVASLLVIPLVFLYGIKLDRVLLAYFALAGVIVASAIHNDSSIMNIVLFMRALVFSYLIYYMVLISLTQKTIQPILKAAVWIAVLQLPIMILQWNIYPFLPLEWRGNAALVDFGSGSFNYKTDYAMSFFLVLMVINLLFNGIVNYSTRTKFIIAFWLTFTIFIANSQIMKYAVLLVWAVFTIRYFSFKNLLTVCAGFLTIGILIVGVTRLNLVTEDVGTFTDRVTIPVQGVSDQGVSDQEASEQDGVDAYLKGNYSRFGALKYFATEGFTWLGDGPLAYSDPINRTMTRGNTGHFFQFFSEIGLIGMTASMVVLLLIAFRIRNGKVHATWIGTLAFLSISILSLTSFVMNDMAVFLIYCITTRAGFLLSNPMEAVFPIGKGDQQRRFINVSTD